MLGGTKVGVGAWGIAVIRTVMESNYDEKEKEKEMLELVRQAEEEDRIERQRLQEIVPDDDRVVVTEVG